MEVWIRRRMIVDRPDTPVAPPSRPIRLIEPPIKQLSQHDDEPGGKGIFVITTIKIGLVVVLSVRFAILIENLRFIIRQRFSC